MIDFFQISDKLPYIGHHGCHTETHIFNPDCARFEDQEALLDHDTLALDHLHFHPALILLSYRLTLPLYLRVSSESLENQMIAMQEESSTT